MAPETGRVYHPAHEKVGSIGLIRSKLAITISQYFEFQSGEDQPPTHLKWNDTRHKLHTNWIKNVEWTPGDGRYKN